MKTITKRKPNRRMPVFDDLESKPCAYELAQQYRSSWGLEKGSCEQGENLSSYYVTWEGKTIMER